MKFMAKPTSNYHYLIVSKFLFENINSLTLKNLLKHIDIETYSYFFYKKLIKIINNY